MHTENHILNKKVSIIIPCYNQGKFVGEAIQSSLNQTYKNIEIVCVNDCSADNSSEIIKDFAKKYKNILFFDLTENKGVINARNLAIEACRGDYILPLDADDTIEPTYVEKAIQILDKKPEIGIVYCKARMFGLENKLWNLGKYNSGNFLYENCIFNCALFRKCDFLQANKYKENMENGHEDWDLWLSFIEIGLKPYQINEVLFNYRQNENRRTKFVNQNEDWKKELIKNHLDLYLNNKNFIEKIYSQNKTKKYKNLFRLMLFISIVEFIALVWVLIKWKMILN